MPFSSNSAARRITLTTPDRIPTGKISHKCLQSSIELVTSIMRAPIDSKRDVCAWKLNNAIDCINEGLKGDRRDIELQAKFASQQSELLRAAMYFLTRCKTLSEHREMLARFPPCRCKMDLKRVRDLHRCCARKLSHFGIPATADIMSGLPRGSPATVVAKLADLMVDTIGLALVKMTPNRFHSQKWPQSPEDLLPFGIEQTIGALRHWAIESPPLERSMSYRLVFLLSTVYDTFGHELCLPAEDGTFKHDLPFVMAILHFKELLDEFDNDLKAAIDLGMPLPPPAEGFRATAASREVIRRVDEFCMHIMRALYLVEHAKGRMVMAGGNLLLVLSKYDDQFKPILDRLSSVCARADPKSDIGHVPMELMLLEEAGPRGDRAHNASERTAEDSVDSFFNQSYREKLSVVWVRLMGVRTWGCLYPECPLPIADSMRTRLCAKCGLVPYCGTECQKKAWKDSRLSHKETCSLIVSLKDQLGEETWQNVFNGPDSATISYFEQACIEKNVNDEMIFLLAFHLGLLQIVKAKRRNSGNLKLTA